MISNLAYIHPNAHLAADVIVEPFAYIEEDVIIGEGCWVGPHTVISNGARLGKNVKVYAGATISAIPQDLKFQGEVTETIIGDNTVIREYVNISRGTLDKHKTIVGSNCLVMAFAHIAHDCIVGDNSIIVNSVQVAGHVEIGNYVIVGGASALHQFVRIGDHVMISGGSLVRKDVPPFTKAAREPLTYCGINSIGLRRRGFSNEQINAIQDTYRIIYMSGLNFGKALEQVNEKIPDSDEKTLIMDFINSSDRGIMRGSS
jgi:UDP-N-acetylglucosamine acyltransferase